MGKTKIHVWYDPEGDFLEVTWDSGPGTVEPSLDRRVMEKVDESGNAMGFSMIGVTKLTGPPFEVELVGTPPSRLVGADEAAAELGISLRRVQKLLSEGRVVGARKISRDWVIPSPVELTPGTRGPLGVARR